MQVVCCLVPVCFVYMRLILSSLCAPICAISVSRLTVRRWFVQSWRGRWGTDRAVASTIKHKIYGQNKTEKLRIWSIVTLNESFQRSVSAGTRERGDVFESNEERHLSEGNRCSHKLLLSGDAWMWVCLSHPASCKVNVPRAQNIQKHRETNLPQ